MKLEQALMDRGSRLMLAWRERSPSTSVGVHVGMYSTGPFLQEARVSTNADAAFRVLLAGPRKYSVVLKEASTWNAFLFDATATGTAAPVMSEKVTTALTDELVRNFSLSLSVDSVSGDSELYTLGYGATVGSVDLGGGVQGKIAAVPPVAGLATRPTRERYLPAAAFSAPTFLWIGTTAQGQGFRTFLSADGSGNYGSTPLWGGVRSSTSDGADCRSGRPGFPSVFGVPLNPTGYAAVGWLESDDAGTACNLLVEGAVFNAAGTHVRKAVMNKDWVVWEQQSAADKSGPTEVVASQRDFLSGNWSTVAKLSTQPVSRLLAQASGPGSSPWAAITWQECASMAADATCRTFAAKSQTGAGALLTELWWTASSGTPLMTMNYYGDTFAVWVEPRTACKGDATKQCAQIRAKRL